MKKKIYLCPKCERALNFSDNPEYTFQCFDCDEDFYEFEAIVKEQPKLEGIKDYTDIIAASVEIDRIANETIKESNKYISLQGKSILEQIGEYIYETIKPIINANMHEKSVFRDHATVYCNSVQLKWWSREYGICLVVDRTYSDPITVMSFTHNGYKILENVGQTTTLKLIEKWPSLKESMSRMIPYGLNEYNKYMQREVEKQKEKADIIENFKL